MPTFYEFFAGGGMARAGIGPAWKCLFANDVDPKKGVAYSANWTDTALKIEDVAKLSLRDLPGRPDLVWASFPCQDLSLAGAGAGLKGGRSGTFWPFWALMQGLLKEGRGPDWIVLENVVGTLTSHGGRDFEAICNALCDEGFRVGAVIGDACHFLPQSRPRVFFIATRLRGALLREARTPSRFWCPDKLVRAYDRLSDKCKASWIWWDPPEPSGAGPALLDLIEVAPTDVRWHTAEETTRYLEMMSEVNRKKVEKARREKRRVVGTMYRRTRPSPTGGVQRMEVRFDGVAGCLRTPAGGSSRQLVVIVEDGRVRSRLISAREAARLMGLPDTYRLPERYNEAYHLLGDGVAVNVVSHLVKSIVEPALGVDGERLAA